MAVLDQASDILKRGLRGSASILNQGATAVANATAPSIPAMPTAGGAVPPVVPPTVAAVDPVLTTPPAPQGLRGATAQQARAAGMASPEAAAYRAATAAAAPAAATVAPAVAAADGLGLRAGRAFAPIADKLGSVARLGASPVAAGTRAGLVVPGLIAAGAGTALGTATTPTETYNRRFGLDAAPAFVDSTSGRLGQLAQDVGVRAGGFATDLGANLLDVGTGLVNGVRGMVGAPPIQSFNDIVRRDDGDPAPIVPAAQPVTAPVTNTPFLQDPNTGFPITPTSSAAPSLASSNVGPQGLRGTGITRTGNSFTNIGADGTVNPGTPVPSTGIRFASDADIARLRGVNPTDSSTLFNGGTGRAVATGTPTGAEPRMVVSQDMSLGGRIERRAAQRAIQNAQAQQELGLRGQEINLRGQQFNAELGLRRDTLTETQRHNDATVGVSREQLAREGLRDAATDRFHQGELQNAQNRNVLEDKRFTAEYGLRARADNRASDEQDRRVRDDGADKYNRLVAQQLPVGPDGKPDQGAANFHTASANQAVADRVAALQRHLKANPDDKAATADLSALQTHGLGALDDADRSRIFAGAEFARLANDTGTGSLNPFGSTNVQSRSPATELTRISRATGDVYRDQLGREVPARYVENVGGARFNGTKNAQFDALIKKGR